MSASGSTHGNLRLPGCREFVNREPPDECNRIFLAQGIGFREQADGDAASAGLCRVDDLEIHAGSHFMQARLDGSNHIRRPVAVPQFQPQFFYAQRGLAGRSVPGRDGKSKAVTSLCTNSVSFLL